MDQRAPATGNGQQIAGDLFDAGGEFAVVVDAADRDGVEPAVAGVRGCSCSVGGGGHGAADQHPGACFDGGRSNVGDLGTGVDDCGDLDAGGLQVRSQRVGAVIGGADDNAPAGRDGVTVEVSADRRGEHDAGAVVVLEDQRAFVGAGSNHHLVGAHVPDPLAGHAGGGGAGQVVGAVLDGDDVVGVVGTEGGGAVQDGALGSGNQFGLNVRHPFQGRLAFNGLGQAGSRGP